MLDILGVSPVLTSWSFSIGETEESTETLYDIVATQNYVVTAGKNNDNDGIFSLRIYNKVNMFFSTLCQKIYPFSCEANNTSDPCIAPCLEDYHFTALGHDSVAVLSTVQTPSALSTVRNGVMLAMFNVSDIVNHSSVYSCYTAILWCNDSTGNADVSALRYDSQNRRLAGLVHYDTTTSTPTLLYPTTKAWIPITNMNVSSTYVRIEKGGWSWYQHLDLDTINARYFAIGHDQINHTSLILSMNRYNYTGCDEHIFRNPSFGYILGYKERESIINSRSNIYVINTEYSPLKLDSMLLQKKCSKIATVLSPIQ